MKFFVLLCVFLTSQFLYASVIHFNNNIKSNNVNFETGVKMFSGTGYDSLSNDTKGDCVTIQEYKTEPSDLKNSIYKQTYSLELIESYESLAKSLQVTANASLKGGWGAASAMANYLESQKIDNYSIQILVKAELITRFEQAKGVMLKDTYLDKINKDLSSFRKACGDEYVRTIMYGGSYYAIMRIDTLNATQYHDVKAAVKANIGTFSSSSELQKTFKKITKDNNLKILTHKIGGSPVDIPTDVKTLLNQIIVFPGEVLKSPAPLMAFTSEYYELENYPSGNSVLDTVVQQENMKYLGRKRLELIRLRNNILYVLENPEQFENIDEVTLQQGENEINKVLNVINLAARKCFVSLDDCKLPENLELTAIIFPKRISENIVSQCYKTAHEICGYLYREDQSDKCGVREFLSHRDKSCGIESYKLSTNMACGIEQYKLKRTRACGCQKRSNDILNCINGCSCVKYKACRREEHGVEKFKTCRHKDNGVDKYKLCISDKPKSYNICRHPSHGIQSVKECMVRTIRNLSDDSIVYERCTE